MMGLLHLKEGYSTTTICNCNSSKNDVELIIDVGVFRLDCFTEMEKKIEKVFCAVFTMWLIHTVKSELVAALK